MQRRERTHQEYNKIMSGNDLYICASMIYIYAYINTALLFENGIHRALGKAASELFKNVHIYMCTCTLGKTACAGHLTVLVHS